MFPDPDPVPVYVEYDCRGRRERRHFADGLEPACRQFFAAKSKAGRNPVLRRADGQPPHAPPPEPPEPIYVQYDAKNQAGKKKRLLRRFPGVTRAAKEFWHAMIREGRYPQFLAADLSPLYGPGSKHTSPEPQPEAVSVPPAPEAPMDTLFDMRPDQLPD